MKNYQKLTEEKLNEIVDKMIIDTYINKEERKVLLEYKAEKKDSFMKRIFDLKTNISKLQLTYGFDSLSDNMLDLYNEVCRQYPTTGASSIFNGLIR